MNCLINIGDKVQFLQPNFVAYDKEGNEVYEKLKPGNIYKEESLKDLYKHCHLEIKESTFIRIAYNRIKNNIKIWKELK